MKTDHPDFEVGATGVLRLRVSVATLVRVVIENPGHGRQMLVLERKATLHAVNNEPAIKLIAQPFGGAIRIISLTSLRDRIGDFHFDSERSRSEQDFRIFIRPSAWKTVRELCRDHLNRVESPLLETNPGRELVEEFTDALKINLEPDQYSLEPVSLIVEDTPGPTQNIHAEGVRTTRVYRVFKATISDPSLAETIIRNSESISQQFLCDLVLQDAQNGGKGRANATLALDLKILMDKYSAMAPEERSEPVLYENNRLSETVPAILDGILIPKYQRL